MIAPALPTEGVVLLDTSAFIYFLEGHPRHYAASDRLFTAIADGGLRGLASVLVLTELLVPYYREGDRRRIRTITSAIHGLPNLEVVDVTPEIANIAARLRAGHNLRTPDAIHVATAVEHGADGVVTNDLRLRRLNEEGLRVWLFDEQVEEE